jgi:hypothetical protein
MTTTDTAARRHLALNTNHRRPSVLSTKSLPATLDVEDAVRRSRQIEALVATLLAERKLLDAQIIEEVGPGNAVKVDGAVTRVKQSSGSWSITTEALESAREAGTISRGMFNNLTHRVVNMPVVKGLREAGRLPEPVLDLGKVGKDSAPYVAHV